MKKRKKVVAPQVFVKAWQSAKNIEDVLKATGMNLHSAQYRARSYRKRGIKLQAFARRSGAPQLDIAGLARLARESVVDGKPKIAAKRVTKKISRKK